MSRRKNEIALRLTLEEQEKLRKHLKEIGAEGEDALIKIDRAGKKAGRGIRAVDEAAKDVRGSLEGVADELGPVGAALKALGPAGIAAGAAVGGAALAVGAAVRIGKEAVDVFSEIGNEADRMGLAVETYQALTAEFAAQGIDVGKLDTAMSSLRERQSQIIMQQGELYSRLKDTHPELLNQLSALDDNEGRIRAVTDALQAAETQIERDTIAYAAFGEAGADVSKILLANRDGIDGLIARGRELGLVVENDLIRNAQQLSTDMDITAQVLDLQLKQAFVDFAPVALDMLKWLGDVAEMARRVSEHFREMKDRTDEFNADRLLALGDSLSARGAPAGAIGDARASGRSLSIDDFNTERMRRGAFVALQEDIEEFNALNAHLFEKGAVEAREAFERGIAGLGADALKALLAETDEQLASLQQREAAYRQRQLRAAGFGPQDTGPEAQRIAEQASSVGAQSRRALEDQREVIQGLIDEAEARAANAEAVEKERQAKALAAKAQAEYERLRRESIKILADLGDATLQLTEYQDKLNRMEALGFINAEQNEAAYAAFEAQVSGAAEAQARWVQVIEAARTPAEALEAQIAALNADNAAGRVEAETFARALAVLREALDEANDAAANATPGAKAAATIRKELAAAHDEARTAAEKYADEQARVNALVASGDLDPNEASEWLEVYAGRLREVTDRVNLWSEAEQILDGIQQRRIRTVEDFGVAMVTMLADVIRQAAQAQAQLGSQGFGQFLGGVLGRVGGYFGFGSGAGGAGAGTTGAGNPDPVSLPTSHTGSRVGEATGERRSLGAMAGDERLRIVRVNQEILDETDRARIIDIIEARDRVAPASMAATPAAMTLDVNMKIRTEGQPAEVRQSRSSDGSLNVDVLLRDKVRGVIASGEADEALTQRGFRKLAS